MNVVFRVDASVSMGTGHLVRCRTIAEALQKRGVHVRFICRDLPGNLITTLQDRGFQVTVLPAPTGGDTALNEDYANWLGVTQAEDASQTIKALDGMTPDWLIVDHYGLDIDWELVLGPHVGKLFVIDDLANRRHHCDALLDQNYSLEGEKRYAGLAPEGCRSLIGPRYALLHPEYAKYRKFAAPRIGPVKKVFVFFGSTDPHNMTGMALAALSHNDLKHLEVDVVIGINNPHRRYLEEMAQSRPNTEVHGPQEHLARLMSKMDLAIGAGGTTTWERMCLGLPTVIISFAENQRPSSQALGSADLVVYAGHHTDIRQDNLAQVIRTLVHDTAKLAELSQRDRILVDGLGAERVVEILDCSSAQQLHLRPAREEDVVLYFNWANDPEVRKNSLQTSAIPWSQHYTWFRNKVHDQNSWLFVLEANALPVGQIRFDREGEDARINYSLDPIVRGRGWGQKLVSLGADRMQQIAPVRLVAEVKEGNTASSVVFQRLGFTEAPNSPGGRTSVFYRNFTSSQNFDK